MFSVPGFHIHANQDLSLLFFFSSFASITQSTLITLLLFCLIRQIYVLSGRVSLSGSVSGTLVGRVAGRGQTDQEKAAFFLEESARMEGISRACKGRAVGCHLDFALMSGKADNKASFAAALGKSTGTLRDYSAAEELADWPCWHKRFCQHSGTWSFWWTPSRRKFQWA
jgi:hypothetical protein